MGQFRPLFVYFRPFLITISRIQIEKSIDGVLGNQTHGCQMVGADKTRSYGGRQTVFLFPQRICYTDTHWCTIQRYREYTQIEQLKGLTNNLGRIKN